jgi:transposase
MDLFVGLDVSVRTTSVCIMDATGRILKESKVETEPDAIGALLHSISDHYKRVGLEAGPLSQWLYSGLAAAGYPVICVETRHMKAALSAQINKTDRNDARGIAQMMRVGLYKPVHVKTIRSQEIRMLLTARRFVQTSPSAVIQAFAGLWSKRLVCCCGSRRSRRPCGSGGWKWPSAEGCPRQSWPWLGVWR